MIEVARYRCPLTRPMRFAGQGITVREGFFVRLAGMGIGEVAPLPGTGSPAAAGCLAVLKGLDRSLFEPGRRSRGQDEAIDRLPAPLAFGLSCARRLTEGDAVLTRPLRRQCGVNALFQGDADEAERAIAEGRFVGFRTVKVKVGGSDAVAERAMIERLLGGLPQSTRVRLDANRAFSLEDAVARLGGLDVARIEYVEEPLADPHALPAFHFATGLSVALDESLLEPGLRALLETAPGVVAHVLKPSLHGRIGRVRARAERTARQGLRTTMSNALETAYTLRLLARLATWLPGATGDHGLATGGLLAGDPTPPPSIVDGALDTSEPLPTPALTFEPLEAIDVG